jgi:hypothetical protein
MRFLIFASMILLLSCNNNQAEKTLVKSSTDAKASAKAKGIYVPVVKNGIEGFYTGMFEATQYDENKSVSDNKITICIDSLDEKNVYGHSVVAGNDRPFTGTYEKRNSLYVITAKEPGDNKYDGVFDFTLNSTTNEIKGSWVANDGTLPVTVRSYELAQRQFKYDPALQLTDEVVGALEHGSVNEKNSDQIETITDDVLKKNPSTTVLKSKDVENMYKTDLEVLRNSIYARHGYSFKNAKMREVFDYDVSWYMPVSTDVTALLTEIEKKNIELIKRYESHATKYYDVFGR